MKFPRPHCELERIDTPGKTEKRRIIVDGESLIYFLYIQKVCGSDLGDYTG